MRPLFNKGIVGIEIGSDSVRVGKVRRTLTGFVLDSFGHSPVPEDFFEEGLIRNKEEAGSLIRRTLEKAGIIDSDAAVSVNSRFTFFKKVTFPVSSMEMLERIYIFEASHHFPFKLKDYTIDYHLLKKERGSVSLLFAAAKNEVIKNRIDTIRLAGLNPWVIEPDVLSLMNLYNSIDDKSDVKDSILVKIEKDCSFIISPDESNPEIIYVPVGSIQLESGSIKDKNLFISSVLGIIGQNKDGKRIGTILLSGEDISHGIIDLLKLKAKVVKYFQPFNHISAKSEFVGFSQYISVVLGLSMRRAGDK